MITPRLPAQPARESALSRYVAIHLNKILRPEERILLDTVFAQKPTQKQLDHCLEHCDIEAIGSAKALMLSYLMYDHPELVFSRYAGPRIKGLINYFRFANLRTLAHFSKVGKALNKANIPVLLFKGAAMRAQRPNFYRPMGDVDILIPERCVIEAKHICEQLGYRDKQNNAPYSIDFLAPDGLGAVDVHYNIMNNGRDNSAFQKELVKRAIPIVAFGVNVLLPALEDQLFLILANLTKNVREFSSIHSMFFALLDCRWLQKAKRNFDWTIVQADAVATDSEVFTWLAGEILNQMVKGLIPTFGTAPPPELESYCKKIVAEDDYFGLHLKGKAWGEQVVTPGGGRGQAYVAT